MKFCKCSTSYSGLSPFGFNVEIQTIPLAFWPTIPTEVDSKFCKIFWMQHCFVIIVVDQCYIICWYRDGRRERERERERERFCVITKFFTIQQAKTILHPLSYTGTCPLCIFHSRAEGLSYCVSGSQRCATAKNLIFAINQPPSKINALKNIFSLIQYVKFLTWY